MFLKGYAFNVSTLSEADKAKIWVGLVKEISVIERARIVLIIYLLLKIWRYLILLSFSGRGILYPN